MIIILNIIFTIRRMGAYDNDENLHDDIETRARYNIKGVKII